jgi:hypothetical protein
MRNLHDRALWPASATEITDGGRGAGVDSGIIPITFDAKHKRAGLEVGSQCSADDTTVVIGSAGQPGRKSGVGCDGEFAVPPTPPPLIPT